MSNHFLLKMNYSTINFCLSLIILQTPHRSWSPSDLGCVGYLEVVEVVTSIQVYAFGLLVDGHDSQADVQRAMELPSLNLKHNHKACFEQCFTAYLVHLTRVVKTSLLLHHCFVWQRSVGSCIIVYDLHLAASLSTWEFLSPTGRISEKRTRHSEMLARKQSSWYWTSIMLCDLKVKQLCFSLTIMLTTKTYVEQTLI